MCFGCSKVPSHRDGSFEYPQHMFWSRNKKKKFRWGPAYWFILIVFCIVCMCLSECMGLFLRVSGVGLWSVLEAFTLVMLTCTCKLIITAKFGSYAGIGSFFIYT